MYHDLRAFVVRGSRDTLYQERYKGIYNHGRVSTTQEYLSTI